MKTLVPIALFVFAACNNAEESKLPIVYTPPTDSVKHDAVKTPTAKYAKFDKALVKQYALNVIDGSEIAGDNDYTYAVFDSISSTNPATRAFYFPAMQVTLCRGTDGGLAETIGDYIKRYLQTNPDEALLNYNNFNKTERLNFTDYLAYQCLNEAHPNEFKPYVKKFFSGLKSKVVDKARLKTLNEIETEVLKFEDKN